MSEAALDPSFDTIIIGSGFGGTMVAHELVNAGERVMLIERGEFDDDIELTGSGFLVPPVDGTRLKVTSARREQLERRLAWQHRHPPQW